MASTAPDIKIRFLAKFHRGKELRQGGTPSPRGWRSHPATWSRASSGIDNVVGFQSIVQDGTD